MLEDLTHETGEPEEILLRRFAQGTVQTGYRPTSGEKSQDYIVRNGVTRNRLIWIRRLPRDQMSKWLDFVRGFRKCGAENGLFFLEAEEAQLPPQLPSHIRAICYCEHVRDFDLLLFCSHIASELNCSTGWKTYLATLAALLCGSDAALAAAYLEDRPLDVRRARPEEAFCEIHKGLYGEDMAQLQTAALTGKVWQAQIKVLYPLIEDARQLLVQRHSVRIKRALEAANSTGPSGEAIRDPLDAEWGTLFHLSRMRNDAGYHCLYIPEEAEYSWIGFMRDCRNKLAHGDALNMEEVARILNMS